MDVTENSSQELHDICEFNVDEENSYLKEREYYALINNCNYYIHRLDTTITRREEDKNYPVKGVASLYGTGQDAPCLVLLAVVFGLWTGEVC